MRSRIAELVDQLVAEHHERDPFLLCKLLDIEILSYDFSNGIKGYLFSHSGAKVIVINENLPRFMKRLICAHELGHALLHEDLADFKAVDFSVYDVSAKPELEANLFAGELLLSDEDVLDLMPDYDNYFSLAGALKVSPELLDFKVRMMRSKGYDIPAFVDYRANFLK